MAGKREALLAARERRHGCWGRDVGRRPRDRDAGCRGHSGARLDEPSWCPPSTPD